MKKILIVGSSGYVGSKIDSAARTRSYTVYTAKGVDVLASGGMLLNQAISDNHPDFVLCAAGYTGKPNVDACELHKDECLSGNAVLPGIIKRVCDSRGVPWGHISSGCIFTGNKEDGSGFAETDPPNFSFRNNHCSFYSGCKALGEESLGYAAVKSGGEVKWCSEKLETGFVWRIRIPFESVHNPRNYISKVITYQKLLNAENSITNLEEVVPLMLEMAFSCAPFGIYNLTQPGSITTKELVSLIQASRLGEKLQREGKEFDFFTSDKNFYETAAKAPRSNCVMNSSKILNQGFCLEPVKKSLEECLNNWKENNE